MTEQELKAEIIDQLKLLDPAIGNKGSTFIANKWLKMARKIYTAKTDKTNGYAVLEKVRSLENETTKAN